jgi:hypothetical protein
MGCAELLTNAPLARRLVDELYRAVATTYDTSVVFEQIQRVFGVGDRHG